MGPLRFRKGNLKVNITLSNIRKGLVRGDVKIQVLATARFCKLLQTLATTGLPTLSQVCQHLVSSGRRALFPDAPLMTY